MSNLSFLMLAVVVACVAAHCTAHTYCTTNDDCRSKCIDPPHAVCDVPTGYCHCHEEMEIPCSNDQTCRDTCPPPNNACCHNDHHCHCSDPCGRLP